MHDVIMEVGVFGIFSGANLGEQATLIAVAANLHRLDRRVRVRNFASGRFAKDYRAPTMTEGDYESAVKVEIAQHLFQDTPEETPHIPGWRTALKRIPLAVTAVRVLRHVHLALVSLVHELRWLWKSSREIRSIDLFLIAGSNQCFDFFGGPWNYPYTLLKWSALAKLMGAKLAFVSVGAGPIRSPLSKRMLRWALLLADYRSFRDHVSRHAVSEFCERCANDPIVPDLAFGLPVDDFADPTGGRVVVGINTMAIFDRRYWPASDGRRYALLVDKFAELIRWLQEADYDYFFFATNPRDVLVVRDIGKRLGSTRAEFADAEIFPGSVEGLMQRIGRAHVVLALRFHGIVLSYALGKPTLALEYWGKTRDLAEDMKQSEYFVSSEEFLPAGEDRGIEAVTGKLDRLIRDRARVSREVHEMSNRNREMLLQQLRDLLVASCPEPDFVAGDAGHPSTSEAGAHLRGPHHAQPEAKARLGNAPADPAV
jgi:polysaccharide pyruvyl transferase WcaK-like protein